MHDLTITPQGHLLVRETPAESPGRPIPKALLDAYATSPAHGMLLSSGDAAAGALPPPFEFARSIARLYLTSLCRATLADPTGAIPEIPPPSEDLEQVVLQAPPMTGLEYLTANVLDGWWRDLDARARDEIERHPGGAQGYLSERDARWRYVGRVTFHLAENKRDPDYPFAFLGTFANGLTRAGEGEARAPGPGAPAVRRRARNREAMLNLLLPVSRAAESSELDPTARRFRRDLSPPRVVGRGRRMTSSRPSPCSNRAA